MGSLAGFWAGYFCVLNRYPGQWTDADADGYMIAAPDAAADVAAAAAKTKDER